MVVFHSLDENNIASIAKIQLGYLEQRLAQMDMVLAVDDAALRELAKAGFDPVFGARPLKRAIQQQIENPLAKSILEGKFGAKRSHPGQWRRWRDPLRQRVTRNDAVRDVLRFTRRKIGAVWGCRRYLCHRYLHRFPVHRSIRLMRCVVSSSVQRKAKGACHERRSNSEHFSIVAHPAQEGFELVDKETNRMLFIRGEAAFRFRQAIDSIPEGERDEETIDEFIGVTARRCAADFYH